MACASRPGSVDGPRPGDGWRFIAPNGSRRWGHCRPANLRRNQSSIVTLPEIVATEEQLASRARNRDDPSIARFRFRSSVIQMIRDDHRQ